jgi:hypothetical protein
MTSTPDQPGRDTGANPAGAGSAGTSPTGPGMAGPGMAGPGMAGPGTARTGAAVGTAPAGPAGQQSDAARQYVPRQAQGYEADYPERGPRGAALGFTLLASVLMMLSGVWGFFEGLAAIIRGSFFVVSRNYVYDLSAVGWGWIHLILGVLIAVAGVALLRDMLWARITGVVLASLIMIANFLFIPYYPFWSFVMIALNAFVIWALLTPRRD